MSTVTDNRFDLDSSGLRQFGLLVGSAFAVIFGLFLPWLFDYGFPVWPWVLAGVLFVWGLAAPDSLQPVYRLWMRFGLALNRVTSPLILGILFYGIFTPVSVVMKIIGRDAMHRSFDADADSYRVVSNNPHKEKFRRPF